MSELISIRPFTKTDFADIISIANKRLGENYLDEQELDTYLNQNSKWGLVAEINNKIVGFALAQACNKDELISQILSDHQWFNGLISKVNSIGLLKTIAVDPQYTNRGVGTALTKKRIEILQTKSDLILAVSWQQKQDSTNIKILEKSGLTLKREIKNYWMEDSLQKGYSCRQCGIPPCKCNAFIYVLV